MGLIKAAMGAAGGVMADQWKEFFYCDAIPAEVLAVKGQKRVSGRSSNKHGSDNIISNGSVIAVADGQCMMIVEQGKVVDVCAEPGEYTYDFSTEPSLFTGSLSQNIGAVFQNIGKRFTFGGEPPKDQRVYYFNTKELIGNKYGTPSPVPFRVVDQRAGIDIDIAIRCFGEYSYRICDPILFYTNVCGNVEGDYTREQIDSQLRRIGMQTIQAVAGSPERLDTIIERLKQQSLGLQKQRDDLLEAAGLLEIYRDDGHVCKRCEDTGYIGSTKCECFQKLLREAAFDALGASHPQDCRFSNFSLDYYSPQPLANGVVPRQRMAQVKNFCSDYARDFFVERHSFSKAQSSPSLLFLGNTGLGKTHLSLAIAGQVINKGYGVIYGSAQNLLAKLEKEKFSFNNTEDQPQSYLSLVLECDLLILDDLGTEFLSQFVTAMLYNIINTRLLEGRPTIISTNLSFQEISKRYTDRLTSRLFGGYMHFEFLGRDIRIQSKIMG